MWCFNCKKGVYFSILKWDKSYSRTGYQAICNICKSHIKETKKPGKLLPNLTMGAINQSSAVYLSISNGLLCRRVQEPTKASVTRVSENNGKTYHEEFYKGWSGKITDIQTRDSQFGKEWCVTINDGNVTAILSFKYSSGYARSFLKCLPNIDLSKDVTITPKKEEKKTTIFINQNGPVKWAYTKDSPNGCPEWKTMKVKGVEVNDDTEMMEFLEQMVKTKFAAAQVETEDDVPF